MKHKSHVYCMVKGCKTFYSTKRNISFHWFPEANKCKVEVTHNSGFIEIIDKRLSWVKLLDMSNESMEKKLRVCSKHFRDEDFVPGIPGNIMITIVNKLNLTHMNNIINILRRIGNNKAAFKKRCVSNSKCT